ncbi:porin [Pelomonas sp. CA6]|uniref:porin n=1 Tax=Pelomonas sp. CA6 TaxID=2907999 RepID=UPI001F4BEB3F|nr:porin [Pelomonas sp. CA6]MCH7345246.1 porin [Pelomonas sp. CA6]
MKKTLAVGAVLSACAGAAAAQSNVTISGLLDIGVVRSQSAGVGKWLVGRGNNNRLIFSGVEDLGDGLSATFAMQTRFEPDTGTQELGVRPFWQGETRVGLRSKSLGWLRIGRGLTSVQDPNGRYEPFGVATTGNLQDYFTAYYKAVDDLSKPLDAAGVSPAAAGGEGRWDNAVFYDSPSFGGLVIRAAVQAEHAENTRPFSFSLNYDSGPLSLLLGYERNNRNTRNIQAAGSYDFGVAKLMGTYTINDPVGPLKVTGLGVGVNVPLGGMPLTLRAGYGQVKSSSTASSVVVGKKLGAGLVYTLSKRTYLYTDVGRGNPMTTAVKTTQFDLGMAHAF